MVDPRYSTGAWRRLRVLIVDRALGLCEVKGRGCQRYATEADHIVAVADGGDFYDPRNLRAACRTCNATAGAAVGNRRRGRGMMAGGRDYVTRF